MRRVGGLNPLIAPSSSTYIVQVPDASLANAQALSALATGILKSTTATGVVSIATAGTDYVAPGGVAGGQTIKGDTAASGNLTLQGTANATPGTVIVNGPAFQVSNTANTATDHAYAEAKVNSTSAGDPHFRYTIPSGTSWYTGVDNSDSDKWELGTGTAVGTNPLLSVTTTGLVGIGTVAQAALLEVLTATDTSTGAPTSFDNRYVTIGPNGGASGGALFFGYTAASNTATIGSLTPGVAWRNLQIQPGGGTLSLGTVGNTTINLGKAGGSLGFFGAAAIAQYNTTGTAAGFTAGAGTGVTDQSTFTGNTGATAYRISDIVRGLKLYGLFAS